MAKKFILKWRHGCGKLNTATVIVSDEDSSLMRNKIWRVVYKDGKVVAVITGSGRGRIFSLARLITNAQDDQEVEFLNGDRLDCRRSNLRLAIKWTSLSAGGHISRWTDQ